MYVNTLTISPKGQIVLPKKVRNFLNTNIITLEVNDNNQVIISPIHDVGGALASYKRDTNLSFQQIRDQAWNNSVSILKDQEGDK